MAKRKRRKKKKRQWRWPSLPSIPTPDWPTTRRFLYATSWLAAAGAAVAAWIIGVPRLEAYASQHQATDALKVRFLDVPAWARGDLEPSLAQAAVGHINPDPLRREGLLAAREALLSMGWFDEIRQIRRADAALVEIDARWAQPFAVVRDGSAADHLIDSRGRLLPRFFAERGASPFIAIVGAQYGRPDRPGQPWPGAEVTAALQVLQLIHGRDWRQQIAEVDVSRFLAESSIRLLTDRGCSILWGRAPDDEVGTEVPAERKLAYLDYHYEQYGHIDRGFLRELDVTGDVVIGR